MEYVLLEKQNFKPPSYQLHQQPAWAELEGIIAPLAGEVAFDWEASGLNIMAPGEFVRSIALANDNGCVSIDLAPATIEPLCRWLADQQLIAHNYIYDGSWIAKILGQVVPPFRDTRAMFMDLANEGAAGQTWSLDSMITNVLGWPENEKGLIGDYFKRGLGIMDIPWEELGPYGAEDAAATWQGRKYFESVIDKYEFNELRSYQDNEYRNSAALVIEQLVTGIPVDRVHLLNYARTLEGALDEKKKEFFAIPEIRPHVEQYNKEYIENKWSAPKQFNKDGSTSKNYLKYLAKIEKAKTENHMNINSALQMQWLFYEQLEYDPVKWTKTDKPSTDKEALPYLGEGGKVKGQWKKIHTEYNNYVLPLIDYTEQGRLHPPVKVPATVTGRLGAGSSE